MVSQTSFALTPPPKTIPTLTVTVMAAADIRQRMADLGLIVKTSRPAAFAAVAKADQAYWGNVIKEYNIRLD